MSRLSRFEDYRWVGTRDDMTVYDCDDPDQFAAAKGRIDEEDLVGRLQIQVFSPDTLDEALNRGFSPI